jgi:hypothetical protein
MSEMPTTRQCGWDLDLQAQLLPLVGTCFVLPGSWKSYAEQAVHLFPPFSRLSAFSFTQCGLTGVGQFHDMISTIEAGNYDAAAHAIIASNWDQKTPSREEELAAIMRG